MSQTASDRPADPRRVVLLVGALAAFILLLVGGSIGGSYALTLHQIAVNNAVRAASQHQQAVAAAAARHREEVQACGQFGGLVESIVQANNDTRHAVTASKSFGELFSVAVQDYYAKTGCSRYFHVSGG
jgi:gamma-glutamyltranspeptidase